MTYHLKTRIAIAVSIMTMVFVLLISWAAHLYFEKEFKKTASNYLSDSLSITAQDLSNRTHQTLHILEIIRNTIPAEIMNDPQAIQQFLDGLDTEKLIFDNGIGVFSVDGTLQAITPRQDDILGMDFSFRDYIKVTLMNRQPYISAPIKARQKHHHPIILFTEPIFTNNEEITGILAGSFDLHGHNFLQSLMNSKLGKSGYYMMLDQQETILIHPDKDNILKPASDFFPQALINKFLVNSHGLIPQVTINGEKMMGAFQHISPLNWTLVALTPLSEAHKPIVMARIYTLAALTVLFVLLIVAVRALTNKLTSPLTELSNEISQLASNDALSVEFESDQYKEMGDLSKALACLVNDLGTKRKGLSDQLVFLQNLIDTIPGPIFYKGTDFRYLGCNKAFEEYLGVERQELIGKTAYDIAPAELADIYQKSDIELWEQGGEQVYETSLQYADGTVHDVILYKNIFDDTNGKPAGLIGTFLDITDRKYHEALLQNALTDVRAAKEQVDNILESAADGIIVTDRRNQITHLNHVAEEIIGVSAQDIIGRPFTALFTNKALQEQARDFLSDDSRETHQMDFKMNLSDSELPRIIQARSSVIVTEEGKRSGVVTMLRDVSRERELDELKSEFISTAAHELRTPMSIIMGYIEILKDRENFGGVNKKQEKKFLQEAYSKGEALSRIIDDLFDISRIEAGLPLPIDKRECDLNEIIGKITSHYSQHSGKHTFKVNLEDPALILADQNKMSQVFENLISNALKYSPAGGEIRISCTRFKDYWDIIIADQGNGMTDEQLERVFDKFYRADSSDTAITGLGLGMSIVKNILEVHDGKIEITSTLGRGTCVKLQIPALNDWQK